MEEGDLSKIATLERVSMKKNTIYLACGFSALIAAVLAFVLLCGQGFTNALGEYFYGYDFVFGNQAHHAQANTAMIASFVLMLIGALFLLLALGLSFGKGGKKFAGFIYVLSGILFLIPGVLFFTAQGLIGSFITDPTLTLGWGFIASGAAAIVTAVLCFVPGFMGLLKKN